MQLRAFEIRDHMTCIPALAIRMSYDTGEGPIVETDAVQWLIRRGGFKPDPSTGPDAIILIRMGDQKAHCDPYDWCDRTMKTAHEHIESNWGKLANGDVIDVRFILRETTAPCESDRLTKWESVS